MTVSFHRWRLPPTCLALGLLAGTASWPGDVRADAGPSISYEATAERTLVPVEKFLRTTRTLERIQQAAALTNLPATLHYRARSCGYADAWYAPEEHRITLCYEYVRSLWAQLRAHPGNGSEGLPAIQGFVDLTLLHETAHALFDLLNVPVLGREEDAADQAAAMIMLQFPKPEATRKLRQVVRLMKASDGLGKLTVEDVADDHSLASQRLYNIVCLAYGQSHRSYRRLVLEIKMPLWRRRACGSEYRQVRKALRVLIRPHVKDQAEVFTAIRAIYREE